MDIFLTSLPLQILAAIIVLFSAILSYFRPPFIALILPSILPLYLVKIYFRPQSFLNFQSYFEPQFSETPVVRPDFMSHNLVIPSNLLEVLIIIFLLLNIPLIIRGFKLIFRGFQGKYFLFSVLILLLGVVISTANAVNLRVALGAAKSWFFLPVLLFFTLVPLLKNSKFRLKFLYSIAFSGIIVALAGALFLLERNLTYDGRLTGIYLSPNHLAMAVIPGIIALFSLLRSTELSKNIKKVGYIFLFIELMILYFSYSYGAWVALILATGLIILKAKDQKLFLKKLLPYYCIPVLILVFLAFSQLNNPKLQHIINRDYYSSLHSRLMIWNSALLISRDHPFSGIGTDNFQQTYLDYQKFFTEPYLEWSAPQPHNIFLAVQTQLGILGLLGFLPLIFFTFQKSGDGSNDPLKFFALAYLTYIIFHGLVDTPYFKNDFALIFWMALGVLWGVKISPKKISKNLIAKV